MVTRRLNGGLHYGFAYGLTAAELQDGGDFDIFRSGSIGSRRALIPFTICELDQQVRDAFMWEDIKGNAHMFAVLDDGTVKVKTNDASCFGDSVFTAWLSGADGRCTPHFWSAAGWLYVSNGKITLRWGGVGFPVFQNVTVNTVHPMSVTPQVTNMGVPGNCTATTYRDTVFIGDVLVTSEDADSVWWSAPVAEQPVGAPIAGQVTGQEDFYDNQRITFISGSQGDRISKLISAGPNLYAFKRHSVHVLSTNGSTVLTNDLSTNLGLAGNQAVTAHEGTVFFFDEFEGLHALSGGSLPQKIFDPIFPLLDCGRISNPEKVAVGFDGEKVFVSVCLDGADENNVTFVLNTNISSTSTGGSWSKWDVGFSSFERWQPQDGDSSLVGFCTSPMGAVRMNECSESMVDDFGFVQKRIKTWFRTALFDDGLPSTKKRWKGVALTVTSLGEVRLRTSASIGVIDGTRPLADCDLPSVSQPSIKPKQQRQVVVDLPASNAACFDPCLELSEGVCDRDSSGEVEDNGVVFCAESIGPLAASARVRRVASPGTGVSFSLEVRDNGSDKAWTVDEVDVKYSALPEVC